MNSVPPGTTTSSFIDGASKVHFLEFILKFTLQSILLPKNRAKKTMVRTSPTAAQQASPAKIRKNRENIGRTITSAVWTAHYYINQFRLRIMNRTSLRRPPSKHSSNGKGTEQVFHCAAGQEGKTLELIKLCRKDTVETEDQLEEIEQNFGCGKPHNDYIEMLSNSDLKDFVDYEEETQACLF